MTRAIERRLLILAPLGRDATLIASLLPPDELPCFPCRTLHELVHEAERGAAALLLTEEALYEPNGALTTMLEGQPAWSDLPVLVLTRTGASSAIAEYATHSLGNVTLLERPVRIAALSSAVRTALRARARQYQIRQHLAERDRADRRKDEFLATLAHELRNPLAPIRSSLDLLHLNPSPAAWPEVLQTMDRQVNHMMRLVDDLMDVSRVTRGRIHLRLETVDLAAVMRAAVEISRPQVDAAKHRLTLQFPAEGVAVDADRVRLTQVFANLLNNAAKYTNAGGEIRFAGSAEGGEAKVVVSDSGIGISPDALPHLFEMFYQASDGQRLHAGLGIGLTLVRTLVEMHGGEVAARSGGAGRGSEFTVRLPLCAHAALPVVPQQNPQALRGLPRVMVVDDNHDAADSLAMLLEMLGAEVRVAHDGEAALQAFDAFHPEAMFLDIGMPGMDGYELAGRVRERPEAHDTLLVALTGWGQDRDRQRTREAGFAHHLVKPADASHLRAVLESLHAA